MTDYEVVTSQAIKNLRYLDRVNIGQKLTSTKDNLIGTAVWHDGVRQANRDAMIALINNAGSNMRRAVVIVQPSVRKVDYDETRGSPIKAWQSKGFGGSSRSMPCCCRHARNVLALARTSTSSLRMTNNERSSAFVDWQWPRRAKRVESGDWRR